MAKIINKKRFDILRGYYKNNKFHSNGKDGISKENLLHEMDFESINDFVNWYKILTQEEVKEGKKDWCSGNCCQSILIKLLEK